MSLRKPGDTVTLRQHIFGSARTNDKHAVIWAWAGEKGVITAQVGASSYFVRITRATDTGPELIIYEYQMESPE